MEFSFQRELLALLKPALDEMKEMTSHVRQRSDLKEKIVYYQERLPVMEQAIANVDRLSALSKDKSVSLALKATLDKWRRQRSFVQSELQGAQLQFEKLIASEVSISEASQSYLKSFFQQRGLYLTAALGVVLCILLLDGLPWRVQQINVFCSLYNPDAELTQRVPIDDLVDLKSRPARSDDLWFPCKAISN